MGLMAPISCNGVAKWLPEPEDVFLAWLLAQPSGGDLESAAEAEIEKIRRYDGPHDGPKRLGSIFETFRASLRPKHRMQ